MNRFAVVALSLGLVLSFHCHSVLAFDDCIPAPDKLQYPPSALQQRMQGSLTLQYTVDSEGKAGAFKANGHPLFNAATISALGLEQFGPSCIGKHVTISVEYKLDDNLSPASPIIAKKLSSTAYEVVAPAPMIEITIRDPGPTRRERFLHRMHDAISKLHFW